ncbi:MAG: hypothetical protein CME06_03950 [Gemmatimonadetes bacterium]|nr:hypothetical protein [Gemmatimonadota bacterium]
MSVPLVAEEFADVLDRTIEGHRDLLRVSRDEQNAVVRGDVARVEELMWQKEQLAGTLREMQDVQQALLRKAAEAEGIDDDVISLTALLQRLPRSTARARLRQQRDELRLLAQTLERTHRVTTRLLMRALQFADASIRMLKEEQEENPIYAAGGALEKNRGERKLMDRMA